MGNIIKIEKEDIPSLSFKKEEVLTDQEQLTKRKVNLAKAMTLGNGEKQKVKIFFVIENDEIKVVDTTIWAIGAEYITLKAGVSIPIQAIKEIEF